MAKRARVAARLARNSSVAATRLAILGKFQGQAESVYRESRRSAWRNRMHTLRMAYEGKLLRWQWESDQWLAYESRQWRLASMPEVKGQTLPAITGVWLRVKRG